MLSALESGLVENIKGTSPFALRQGCEVRAVIEVPSFLHRAHPKGIGSMAALSEVLRQNPHRWKQHQTELCLRGVSIRVKEFKFESARPSDFDSHLHVY